jgi:hypothetical protein
MKTNSLMESQVMEAVRRGVLEVDPAGRVWRLKKRTWDMWQKKAIERPCLRVRAENRTGLGYLQVRVMIDHVRAHVGAHRIVYAMLVGPIPKGMWINHKNGIKDDNRPSNLELATPTENVMHARKVLKVGRLNQDGEKNCMHKLSPEAVRDILRYQEKFLAEVKTRQGHVVSTLMKKYGVSQQTIFRVLRRKSWASIS